MLFRSGARAIMFLSADNEVGKYAKVRYEVASKNAKTAAERAFDADKAAKLDSLQSQLLPYMQAAVIGNKMLERAEQQVSRDMSERAGTIYFQDTSVSVDNAVSCLLYTSKAKSANQPCRQSYPA